MYLRRNLGDRSPVVIIVGRLTKARLMGTCFRNTSLPVAGNFLRWNRTEEMLNEPLIVRHLLSVAQEDVEECQLEDWDRTEASVCVDFPKSVGWESTAPIAMYEPRDLEVFKPNRHSCALRIKPSTRGIRSPKTSLLTFVYQLRRDEAKHRAWVMLIKSIYPGEDIGEIHGDITAREERVFFDWNHPGA